MTNFKLFSQRNTEDSLAKLVDSGNAAPENVILELQVREDKCFQGEWIGVGTIRLFPEPQPASDTKAKSDHQRITDALRFGFYEWSIPSQESVADEVESALRKPSRKEASDDRWRKIILEAVKSVAHIAARCGLAHPVFDALMLGRLRSRRPLSVVVDTNAVLQGGLDFLARYFTPQARIKVPALVHMEILNFNERYFTRRRNGKNDSRMLLDHVNSQGGQRVLLRLETDQGLEFERPRLGADPLRGVVSLDSDAEDKNLGLQRIQRSFADRLILETAVRHRDQVEPEHRVLLMTADQGLARMALAESIEPMFFDTSAALRLFGKTLCGTTFAPFSADGARFNCTALVDVVWEFAASFGAARLRVNGGGALEVVALGEDLAWQPYHSYEDLLWVKEVAFPSAGRSKAAADRRPMTTKDHEGGEDGEAGKSPRSHPKQAAKYSFSVGSMIRLVDKLHETGDVPDRSAKAVARITSARSYRDYCNFLMTGGFATHKDALLVKTERLDELYTALRERNYRHIADLMSRVESFRSFVERLPVGGALRQQDSGFRSGVFRTYGNLSEICCLGVRFPDQGAFGTPNDPPPREFVKAALNSYETVRCGEGFALTGSWLEELVIGSGIHPVRARQRLAECYQAGYLERYFEGSTPDTRFENRTMHVLDVDQGKLVSHAVNLYHGDFLIPGRASVSIKLSKGAEM